MDFSAFDQQVNLDQLKADAEEIKKNGGTGDYPEVEAGIYHGRIEKLELGATKDNRPMMKVQFRITEDPHKNQCLFMNRVLYGTKNDGNMVASALGWLDSLEPSEDIPVIFESFSQFSDLCMDIAEDIAGLEYDVAYDPNKFNTISVEEVFE